MSDPKLQVHVEMKNGAIARVSPKALNDPKFVDALNKMIGLASKWARKKELRRLRRKAGGGGAEPDGESTATNRKTTAKQRAHLRAEGR